MRTEELIKQRALERGFDLAGVAPLDVAKDLEFSRRWVEQGYGGEMRYLENARRHDPRRVLPSAQSVVCVALVYNAPLAYSTEVSSQESGVRSQKPGEGRPSAQISSFDFRVSRALGPRAWISRYAWGRDYHQVMRAKLEALRREIEKLVPGVETRVYVDTGPVVERAFARYSGIGWTGKNTCLINQQKGSWFFLGVILTSLALEPDLPAPDRCGSCTACLKACPTGALAEPYVMDASRCIAYLNIELKGSIPAEFRAALGSNVFGCDICQDVCPWNSRPLSVVRRQLPVEQAPLCGQNVAQGARPRNETGEAMNVSPLSRSAGEGRGVRAAATTTLPEFLPMPVRLESRSAVPESPVPSREPRTFSLLNPRLEDLAAMTEDDFRQSFRHSPLKRARYRGWLRNLCVAMGNSGDARFVPKLTELAAHPDPVVREHAAWALPRVGQRS